MSSNEILIYDIVGSYGTSSKDVADLLAEFDTTNDIIVRINSPGGDVFDGITIYNILKSHQAKIHVFIDGLAGSVASIIAMAGDTVNIAKAAMIMLHNPSVAVYGSVDDLMSSVKLLEKITVNVRVAYADKTKLSVSEISDLMDAETWLMAKEAFELGFVDSISDSKLDFELSTRAINMIDKYKNVPVCIGNKCKMIKEIDDCGDSGDQLVHSGCKKCDKLVDAVQLNILYPDLVTEIKHQAGQEEIKRIQAVENSSLPGNEALINKMRFDGVTTGAEAAIAVVKAERLLLVECIAARAADSVVVSSSTSNEVDTPEQSAERRWASDADLRASFGDSVENYKAYNCAVADGQVKVVGKS